MTIQPRALCLLVFVGLAGFGLGRIELRSGSEAPKRPRTVSTLATNESFINGLYSPLSLDSSAAVFRYVFERLAPDVTVYPSENYYYFELPVQGRVVTGSLSLTPADRDSAQIGFAYTTRIQDKARARFYFTRGGGGNYGQAQGVRVRRTAALEVTVSAFARTVRFHLHDLKATPPTRNRLRADEEYVLSNFDDSGLQFHLIYSQPERHLFWILNEEGYVPETFSASRHLLVGDRTEFVFYADSLNARKILVGVAGLNVRQNNWYDGPFDQLADNLIEAGRVRLKPYLLAHYGGEARGIDDFGAWSREGRMAVAPYTVYHSREDLSFVDSLEALRLPYPEFCRRLTEQKYPPAPDAGESRVRRYY